MLRHSQLHRVARRLLWSRPRAYRWFGILRNRGDCLNKDFDVWVGGYPRSANSFAAAAFKLSNPGLRVASHWHIPAFIISALHSRKPGMLLIRRPKDAVLSWTIFWEGRWGIENAIDYYLDFHRTLLRYRSELFVATFEDLTRDFTPLTQRFNEAFRTNYSSLPSDGRLHDRCVSYVEDLFREPDGSLNEFRVPRPSAERRVIKSSLEQKIGASQGLLKKLGSAEEIYSTFQSSRRMQGQKTVPQAGSPTEQLTVSKPWSVVIS